MNPLSAFFNEFFSALTKIKLKFREIVTNNIFPWEKKVEKFCAKAFFAVIGTNQALVDAWFCIIVQA